MLEQIVRKANVKLAKEMADTQQQEYIVAEKKARAQEETMRKVHQKEADKAMDVSGMEGGRRGGREGGSGEGRKGWRERQGSRVSRCVRL